MDANAKPKTSYEKKKPSIYIYTNGERITKKNITSYEIKLKPYINVMWKVKRKLANAKNKKEWYARKKAERLATIIDLNEKNK